MLASHSSEIDVRGLSLHLRQWHTAEAGADAPVLLMLHGWMDVSASFQFLVDELRHAWRVIAPDWRGFGASGRSAGAPGATGYWWPDYFADLESLIDQLGQSRVHLVGHSMGGNIAAMYAGIRPARIASLTLLDAFGLAPTSPSMAPARYARWLDELANAPDLRPYASLARVESRLMKNNPRLTPERARWLAPHWASLESDGLWHLNADPAHRLVNPVLYRLEEAIACWEAVTAPVLWVQASETDVRFRSSQVDRSTFHDRTRHFADLRVEVVDDCGHMVHHDQPAGIARLIESFVPGRAT